MAKFTAHSLELEYIVTSTGSAGAHTYIGALTSADVNINSNTRGDDTGGIYDQIRFLVSQMSEYTFTTKDGSRPTEVKTAEYRIYTVRQLCEVLQAAGLVGIEALGDLDGSPFELGCHHVHVLGSKP